MANTLKIELDLPDFDKELSVNIIVRKDGTLVVPPSISRDKEISHSAPIIPTPIVNPPFVPTSTTPSPVDNSNINATSGNGAIDFMTNGKW